MQVLSIRELDDRFIKLRRYYIFMKHIIKDPETRGEIQRKRENLLDEIKKYDIVWKNRIVEGDKVIYDALAFYCVIVILYDKKNKRGGVVHIENPDQVNLFLETMIQKMRDLGSVDIVSLMAGGGSKMSKKAIANWRKVRKSLRRNEIRSFKHGGLKDVYINNIAIWTKTGKVKYTIGNATCKERKRSGEFTLK